MSYSFSVQAPTKAEAEVKVSEELAKVIAAQPVHEADSDQAFEAAAAFIKILADDEGKDVVVSVNGSLTWRGEPGAESITWANVHVTASLQERKA